MIQLSQKLNRMYKKIIKKFLERKAIIWHDYYIYNTLIAIFIIILAIETQHSKYLKYKYLCSKLLGLLFPPHIFLVAIFKKQLGT